MVFELAYGNVARWYLSMNRPNIGSHGSIVNPNYFYISKYYICTNIFFSTLTTISFEIGYFLLFFFFLVFCCLEYIYINKGCMRKLFILYFLQVHPIINFENGWVLSGLIFLSHKAILTSNEL